MEINMRLIALVNFFILSFTVFANDGEQFDSVEQKQESYSSHNTKGIEATVQEITQRIQHARASFPNQLSSNTQSEVQRSLANIRGDIKILRRAFINNIKATLYYRTASEYLHTNPYAIQCIEKIRRAQKALQEGKEIINAVKESEDGQAIQNSFRTIKTATGNIWQNNPDVVALRERMREGTQRMLANGTERMNMLYGEASQNATDFLNIAITFLAESLVDFGRFSELEKNAYLDNSTQEKQFEYPSDNTELRFDRPDAAVVLLDLSGKEDESLDAPNEEVIPSLDEEIPQANSWTSTAASYVPSAIVPGRRAKAAQQIIFYPLTWGQRKISGMFSTPKADKDTFINDSSDVLKKE